MMPGVYPTVILDGLGRRPGGGRGLGGRAQQCLRARQEDLAGLGEPGALRGAVEQLRAELLLELADLPAQRRLRDAQLGGGAAEVPVLGDGGEVPHQPQVQVDRVFQIRHERHRTSVCQQINMSCGDAWNVSPGPEQVLDVARSSRATWKYRPGT